MTINPFNVSNPEYVDDKFIAENFVDVFTDFPRLKDHGNTFIHGARGTGKSMLLRSLEPYVMLLRGGQGASLSALPFLAVHVPLRRTEFAVPELTRSKGYVGTALGEHLLCMQVVLRVAEALEKLAGNVSSDQARILLDRFADLYVGSGGPALDEVAGGSSSAILFARMARTCEREVMAVRQYHTRLPFQAERPAYGGALTGFLDFVVPLARAVQQVEGLPSVPLFLMLDDADNLPVAMQRVLNSWVSTRSTPHICLKITTQLAYATLKTLDNRVIESPHDFAEVNLGAVYTTENDNYGERVREIVSTRLRNAGLPDDVYAFFPRHEPQAARLKEIEDEITREHSARGAGTDASGRRGATRARDERVRYTVPRYMREIAGSSRSSHTFSYSGFKSLVDVSSGVVRWFLDPAGRMFDRMASHGRGPITSIPVGVQDEIIKTWSTEFVNALTLRTNIEVPSEGLLPEDEASLHALGHEPAMYERLGNLVDALGRLFRRRVLDAQASEQRIISIVLADDPDKTLLDVLMLGERLGYLQRSDNAAKKALGGRRPRWILARRLGPHYRFDVSGYAAHLSVTSADLAVALKDPAAFVKLRLGEDAQSQLSLALSGMPRHD